MKKLPDDLNPGDVIAVELTCLVRVASVERVVGNAHQGNRKITYTDATVVVPFGHFFHGSALHMEVAPPE